MTTRNAIIFLGPSLTDIAFAESKSIDLRPPAAQGDVYLAALERPRAIGLIDGYFDGVPAVWHKEILWAMSQGIHVFGASSMGALRAAELHQFGMQGIGRVFEDFRDGKFSDDDEVALLHGPKELGFPALSEPMVNVRATLDHAVLQNVITADDCSQFVRIAKAQFYQSRTWNTIFEAAEAQGMAAKTVDKMRCWIPGNLVDQKRLDALELIDAINRLLQKNPPPFKPQFVFEWTQMWDSAPWIGGTPLQEQEAVDEIAEGVLDELRLLGTYYFEIANRALSRAFLENAISPADAGIPRGDVLSEIDRFRRSNDLVERGNYQKWLANQNMSVGEFERMMAQEAQIRSALRLNPDILKPRIIDQLRLSGDYERLLQRSLDKVRRLEGAQLNGGQLNVLIEAHCTRMNCTMPNDAASFAAELGLANEGELARLLRKEEIYMNMVSRESARDRTGEAQM